MKKVSWVSALALSAAVASVACADITGNIKLDGAAPEAKEIDMAADAGCKAQHADPVMEQTVVAGEKGELANVIVFIKAEDPAALGGEASKDPVVLDQKGCMYEPHVLSMTVGQDLVVKNDDSFLHNVHSLATINPAFNFGQPNKDPGKKVPEAPKATETFRVKCDVHPWMSAYIGVFEHPFHAVSGEDGKYTIKGKLPDGEYTLVAWHEKFGEKEEKITVKDGKAEKDFSIKPEAAMIDPAGATIELAASVEKKTTAAGAKTAESECTACCPDKAKAALSKQAAEKKDEAKAVAPQAVAR
jgi:plastocyanin